MSELQFQPRAVFLTGFSPLGRGGGAVQLFVFDFPAVCFLQDFMILPAHSTLLPFSLVINKPS